MRDTQKYTYWFHELSRCAQDRAVRDELARRATTEPPRLSDIRDDIHTVLRLLGYQDGHYDDATGHIQGLLAYNSDATRKIKEAFPSWLALHSAAIAMEARPHGCDSVRLLVNAFDRDLDIEREAWLDEGEIAHYLYEEGFIFLENGDAASHA